MKQEQKIRDSFQTESQMSMNPNQSLSYHLITYQRMNLINFLNHQQLTLGLQSLLLPTTALTSMTPPPVPVRRAAFLPTSLTDVAFGLQRDDSIAAESILVRYALKTSALEHQLSFLANEPGVFTRSPCILVSKRHLFALSNPKPHSLFRLHLLCQKPFSVAIFYILCHLPSSP